VDKGKGLSDENAEEGMTMKGVGDEGSGSAGSAGGFLKVP